MNIVLRRLSLTSHIPTGNTTKKHFDESDGFEMTLRAKQAVVVIRGNGVLRVAPLSSVEWCEPMSLADFEYIEAAEELGRENPGGDVAKVETFPRRGRPRKS